MNSIILPPFSGGGQLLEKFAPQGVCARVDPISTSYLTQRRKQEFMKVNITLFFGKGDRGSLIEQGCLLGIVQYLAIYFVLESIAS